MKHATANTFKPASINVEPADIMPLAVTKTPSHVKSYSGSQLISQSTESLGTLAIPIWYFLAYLLSLLMISIMKLAKMKDSSAIALNETKVRAKKLLKACQQDEPLAKQRVATLMAKLGISHSDLQLKHCQQVITRELGFIDFHHCQRVLSGQAILGDDWGGLFHTKQCDTLLNHWFTGYLAAREFNAQAEGTLLLPYKKQFFVVERRDYCNALNLQIIFQPVDNAGEPTILRDLVSSYANADWHSFALAMVQHKLPKV